VPGRQMGFFWHAVSGYMVIGFFTAWLCFAWRLRLLLTTTAFALWLFPSL
jgi:hypothetical protein